MRRHDLTNKKNNDKENDNDNDKDKDKGNDRTPSKSDPRDLRCWRQLIIMDLE